ncbi:MAG: hypothetical protein K1X51_15390 [Rhodospirillaceae bacterium]|nr:hypothetical protein [Rhodospirillaceae bacterium]
MNQHAYPIHARFELWARAAPKTRTTDSMGKVVATADVPEIPRDMLYRLKK